MQQIYTISFNVIKKLDPMYYRIQLMNYLFMLINAIKKCGYDLESNYSLNN